MWPLCRNVTRPWRLMALLGLVSWGGAQSSEVPSEGDSQQAQLMKGAYLEPPFVCDALSDPQLYQDGAMSGMRQLVSGKPYWFFRTDVDVQEDFPVSAMARGELGELVEILREKDLQLVVMLQPTRGLMHADQLVQPWRGRYPLTDVRRSYLRKAELFRDLGAMVADMEPVLEKVDGGEYFFRRDHHWTPAGADVSAYQVAQVMLADPGIEQIPELMFETREGILLRKMGTMNVAVASVCGNAYSYQWVRGFNTVPKNEVDSADALFGDASEPQVALIGTSNSDTRDDRYKNYNFHGFLQQYLSRDVVNFAMTGGGAMGALQEFLYSPAYQEGQFRYLVWELPVNFDLEEPEVWREVLPAASGGCSNRSAYTTGAVTLPVSERDQRVEVLANAGERRRQTAGSGSLTLDVMFSDSAFRHFYVLAYYDDGQREKIRIRRPARLDSGRFTLRLDPPSQGANLLSVLLELEQPVTTALTVEATLCDY